MPRKPKPSAEQTFAIEKLANTGPRGFFTQGLKAAEEFCKSEILNHSRESQRC